MQLDKFKQKYYFIKNIYTLNSFLNITLPIEIETNCDMVKTLLYLHGKGVHRLQNIVDLVQKVGAFHRQLQPIVSAMEQSHAKLAFQFLYAKGNRRLTDKQFLRRLCNTAVAAHRLKILHLQQLHCLLPRVIAHLRLAIKINEIQSFINFIYARLYQIFC